ncbi:MAG TPA: CoA transferase, partial [Acetobacteraceae bacterium]|nr:CoA transferase [Acetobacteraceae bacterium]
SVADSKAWEKRLNDAGAPCASIWRIEEVIDHPQIAARDVLQTAETPYGAVRLMGSGFKLAHGGGRLDSAPPELGAHTDAILRAAGSSAEDIAALRQNGVI